MAALARCRSVPLRPSFTGLWRHPDFVRLWAGETISVFGTLIGGLALSFTAILWLDATPLALSVLAAAQLVPGFAVGIVAGVWVDRLRRRPIMIAADVGRFLALATIPLAAVFDLLTIGQLYSVALTTSTLTVFFDVAYQAYLPTLVTRDELVEGNAKLTASASVAEVASFSLSGWLVQLLTGPGALLIDAVSFLGSALFLARIKAAEPPRAPVEGRESIWREARDGLRVVARDPVVRSLAVANVTLSCASRMVGVVFLLYLYREVGFDPGVLGMIFAVGGVTSLAGSFLAGRSHLFGGLGPALVLSVFMRAAGMAFMPLASSVSVAGTGLLIGNQVVTDPAWTFYEINDVSLRQGVTPHEVQGRMFASVRFLEFGAMLLGAAFGGILGQTVGLRETLFVAVGLTSLAGVWLALSPVARLRAMPAAVVEARG
ncbi:MAG: MFS transporter [Anaerolinea sp.]|nr:MFS transporter [Anaerolinea sp.]